MVRILIIHQDLLVTRWLSLRSILILHDSIIMMNYSFWTEIPVAFCLLRTKSIFDYIGIVSTTQVCLWSNGRKSLSIDSSYESICCLLTKCYTSNTRLDTRDVLITAWVVVLLLVCCLSIDYSGGSGIVPISIYDVYNHKVIIHLIKYRLLATTS